MARRRKKRRIARALVLLFIAAGLGLILWQLDDLFEERHWREFSQAGTRALNLGHYDWAERMYRESLHYAQVQGNDEKALQSYLLLSRLYQMQGKEEQAAEMLARARQLRTDAAGSQPE